MIYRYSYYSSSINQAYATLSTRRESVQVIVPPVEEPLYVADVHDHLLTDVINGSSPHDNWIQSMIPVAREWCESYLGRSIAPQTLLYRADTFYTPLQLPYGPVIEVESVYYVLDGVAQPYVGFEFNDEGALGPGYGRDWPVVGAAQGAIEVRYRAGYGETGSPGSPPLPAAILAAMKILMGHLFEHRGDGDLKLDELPMSVTSLLERSRLRLSMA